MLAGIAKAIGPNVVFKPTLGLQVIVPPIGAEETVQVGLFTNVPTDPVFISAVVVPVPSSIFQ